jgi:hypothetical protein
MRSLLAIVALVTGALAAPADGPQLILTNGAQGVTPKESIVNTDVHSFAQSHGVIETNETIYTYLSQETRYAHTRPLIIPVIIGHSGILTNVRAAYCADTPSSSNSLISMKNMLPS